MNISARVVTIVKISLSIYIYKDKTELEIYYGD